MWMGKGYGSWVCSPKMPQIATSLVHLPVHSLYNPKLSGRLEAASSLPGAMLVPKRKALPGASQQPLVSPSPVFFPLPLCSLVSGKQRQAGRHLPILASSLYTPPSSPREALCPRQQPNGALAEPGRPAMVLVGDPPWSEAQLPAELVCRIPGRFLPVTLSCLWLLWATLRGQQAVAEQITLHHGLVHQGLISQLSPYSFYCAKLRIRAEQRPQATGSVLEVIGVIAVPMIQGLLHSGSNCHDSMRPSY